MGWGRGFKVCEMTGVFFLKDLLILEKAKKCEQFFMCVRQNDLLFFPDCQVDMQLIVSSRQVGCRMRYQCEYQLPSHIQYCTKVSHPSTESISDEALVIDKLKSHMFCVRSVLNLFLFLKDATFRFWSFGAIFLKSLRTYCRPC